jgi:hypothetical protein
VDEWLRFIGNLMTTTHGQAMLAAACIIGVFALRGPGGRL